MKQLTILGVLAISSLSSGSAFSAPRQVQSQALMATVYKKTLAIGGTELITLRGETQSEVEERADIVSARLNEMLGDAALASGDVQVRISGKEHAIFVKEKLLITVTMQDAKHNRTTVAKQADAWCTRLGEVLPTLKAVGIPPTRS